MRETEPSARNLEVCAVGGIVWVGTECEDEFG